MGCTISTEDFLVNGVSSTTHQITGEDLDLDDGDVINFTCADASFTLFLDDDPVAGPGENFEWKCLNNDGEFFSLDIECREPSASPIPTPTVAPTQVEPAPAPNSVVVNEDGGDFIDCPIPEASLTKQGVFGYQVATNTRQLGLARFPVSLLPIGTDTVYLLKPHDTIGFACKDSNQTMQFQGEPLRPHRVNFFMFQCEEKIPAGGGLDVIDFSIPLACIN